MPCDGSPLALLKYYGEECFLELHGKVKEKWGLGPVIVTPCEAIYGIYFDIEAQEKRFAFLGNHIEIALSRMKHVKSFF